MTAGASGRRSLDNLRGATTAPCVLGGIERVENGLFAVEVPSVQPAADKHDPVLVAAGLANIEFHAGHCIIASRSGVAYPA